MNKYKYKNKYYINKKAIYKFTKTFTKILILLITKVIIIIIIILYKKLFLLLIIIKTLLFITKYTLSFITKMYIVIIKICKHLKKRKNTANTLGFFH